MSRTQPRDPGIPVVLTNGSPEGIWSYHECGGETAVLSMSTQRTQGPGTYRWDQRSQMSGAPSSSVSTGTMRQMVALPPLKNAFEKSAT